MGTRLAAYRNEIARLHTQGDDLCVAVSALVRNESALRKLF